MTTHFMTALNYMYYDYFSYGHLILLTISSFPYELPHAVSKSEERFFYFFFLFLQGFSGGRWFLKEHLCHKEKLYRGEVRYSSESD